MNLRWFAASNLASLGFDRQTESKEDFYAKLCRGDLLDLALISNVHSVGVDSRILLTLKNQQEIPANA